MARPITPGSILNEISMSTYRVPRFRVLIYDPNEVTVAQVATNTPPSPPRDITPFVEFVDYVENIAWENADDATLTKATFRLKRSPNTGFNLRRGHMEDGIIVRILQGDKRVERDDWIPIFTGTFRGRPGDDPGTKATRTEGFTAIAFGREERFKNLEIITDAYPTEEEKLIDPDVTLDLGELAVIIASKHMGLTQDEILFGATGFESQHILNQIVSIPALQGLWECFFPTGGKPKFDGQGRLGMVDVNLDKAPTRIYDEDNAMIRSLKATPNSIEVNTSVVLRGLGHDMERVGPLNEKMISDFDVSTGFYELEYKEDLWFSEDHSLRADPTRIHVHKPISHPVNWARTRWTPDNDVDSETRHRKGELKIDTVYLAGVRLIIFVAWLKIQVAIAVLDFVEVTVGNTTRLALELGSLAVMAALLWSMQYLGRGRYQLFGFPFEFVYRELVAQHELIGIDSEAHRRVEFRNDFLSTIELLDARCEELLRRELVKCQTFKAEILDDPYLEVDDIIETAEGDRYYITKIKKRIQRPSASAATMALTLWKIRDGVLHNSIDVLEPSAVGSA